MMRRMFLVTVAVATIASAQTSTQSSSTAPSSTRQHVQTLASDQLDGRLTGSAGERLAGDYIVSQLEKIGAKPVPGQTDYRVPFEFTAGSRDGGSEIGLATEPVNNVQRDFVLGKGSGRALSFSDNGVVTAPIVFAGYGIVVPDAQDFGYDSYAGLDVKDKVVLVLRYFPEDADQKTKGILARYSDLRYKAMQARQHGAKAMLVFAGPRSPNAGELVPMTSDTAIAGSGVVALSITGDVAKSIFSAIPDKPLEDTQKALDSGNPHVTGFAIPGMTARVQAKVEREKQTGRNIVAYLPATTPTTGVQKPWVALGAHYDHLGHGNSGSSLASKEEAGRIHAGADDNASGTAAVLAIGEALSKQPLRRNVLLGLWSGEELGMLGSGAFAARPPVPIDQIAAYLNFDMVGRMQDNKLAVQAAGTSPVWSKILEQANVAAGFNLQVQQDPNQPTDVSTFNQAGVPSLAFFTGAHVDYHRPSDTADKINYEDLDRVVGFASSIARRLAELDAPPEFTKVDLPAEGGGRAGLRVFTGTIPDYATEVKGLLLSGVVGGGPAEQAGLQKGDVIVEIAGQTITNIYDYTYALELLKIGQPVKIAYMRGTKRIETMLTPGARK
jgi:Zn-dependent M28 family amino/carboxypeptidase